MFFFLLVALSHTMPTAEERKSPDLVRINDTMNKNIGEDAPEIVSIQQNLLRATEARKLLEEGNKRFRENRTVPKDIGRNKRKKLSTEGQKPFAVIVGCSDSRVSPELIFDLGLGDIFVIRSAGNLVDDIALGSIEFAIQELNVPLIVVLGHEGCGAVEATVKAFEENSGASSHLSIIIERIRPCVEKVIAHENGKSSLMNMTIEKNIQAVVEEILTRSPIVATYVGDGRVAVFGAKYCLESGEVVFFR